MKQPRLLPIAAVAVLLLAGPSASAQDSQQSSSSSSQVAWVNNDPLIQSRGPCDIVTYSAETQFPYVYFGIHWECIGPTGPMSVSGMDGVSARLFMV